MIPDKTIRAMRRRYSDHSGLWVVVAATGERSNAVSYEAAGFILGAWRKKVQYRGVKLWRERVN
jgi:hypothetical protein